ncbi:MAG TPA: MscL family protein [Terriglobales bacterium]|jgi:large-conductance mechanosensitive channel|nr:MscL family protein [Terriglobales bacterium]
MDENPKAFLEELRSGILKKRVGQIALAVVLAQAVWRLLNAFTWYVLVPIIGKAISGRTESVLFESAARLPFQWESIIGSLLEFTLTVILVFYLNRWIKKPIALETATAEIPEASSPVPSPATTPALSPEPARLQQQEVVYNSVGEKVSEVMVESQSKG